MKLARSQMLAIEHFTTHARNRSKEAEKSIKEVLRMSNIAQETFSDAVTMIKSNARVALHFHPDRPGQAIKSVADSLLEQGIYKSQYETMISNGSVSAYPSGERDLWEKGIFGGAYHLDGVTDDQRPKYGALNLMIHPDGPAPRFGSCYFLLHADVSNRCTYTYGDSHQDPQEKSTFEVFNDILVVLLKDAFVREFAIGEKEVTPRKLIDHLLINLDKPFSDPSNLEPNRNLNHYIEGRCSL